MKRITLSLLAATLLITSYASNATVTTNVTKFQCLVNCSLVCDGETLTGTGILVRKHYANGSIVYNFTIAQNPNSAETLTVSTSSICRTKGLTEIIQKKRR